MLFLNRGGKRAIAEGVQNVHGEVFLPAFNSIEAIRRLPPEHSSRLLVDPQLYLAGLPADECGRTCGRLATFPWFGVQGVPAYDSSESKRRQWEADVREQSLNNWPGRAPSGGEIALAVEAAVDFQLELRAAYVILPAPLIAEREDEGQSAAEWLDEGLAAADRLSAAQPVLATVAVDEGTLNDAAFQPGGFLDAVVDLVSAREGLDGVYVVVSQSSASHPFETSASVQRAYLHLVRGFTGTGLGTVVTNFADVFGLAAMASGSTAFCTGATQSTRRLSLAGFREARRGGAFPRLYSHPCIAEFSVGEDIERIAAARALSRIRDVTEFSQALFDALSRKLPASSVPAWADSANNTLEAQSHFVARLAAEAQDLSRVRDLRTRQEHTRDWLEGAVANALFLRDRLKGSAALRDLGRFAPVEQWLEIIDQSTE